MKLLFISFPDVLTWNTHVAMTISLYNIMYILGFFMVMIQNTQTVLSVLTVRSQFCKSVLNVNLIGLSEAWSQGGTFLHVYEDNSREDCLVGEACSEGGWYQEMGL